MGVLILIEYTTMIQEFNKSERNERILLDIVEWYVEVAQPVSSSELLDIYKYDLSSATLRNIMFQLNEAGYLAQPHTSAGRIPTAKAYKFYVEKVRFGAQRPKKKQSQKKEKVSSNLRSQLQRVISSSPNEVARILSQYLADVTHSMAFGGVVGVNSFYREGLRYLLDEPEFLTAKNIKSLVEYIDSLESRLDKLYTSIQDDIRIFIGEERKRMQETPFSLMAFTQELPNHERAVFGIVGPIRMQYSRNLDVLNEIRGYLNSN
ncbi:MAG: hypothetical protein A2728_02075 [Candidatus Spechtbacteria bacterium RIFCSPHIGHO2_01_FULL_38_11]|nr:MAG: hypothetical protein A2728_02075 [Candidatus Spechtbacteria bacterium RIFCSPHIGHO2_01_FULL_38_11]